MSPDVFVTYLPGCSGSVAFGTPLLNDLKNSGCLTGLGGNARL